MSEGPPKDMKRFRVGLRLMWALMRFKYRSGAAKWWAVPFPEAEEVARARDDARD